MLPLHRLPPLDLLKGFVAVARRLSVTQAAEDLCLTQSAVSKQVRALEDLLGVALFHRGFRRIALTAQGQALFRVADASLRELQEVLALLGTQRAKPVAITTSTGIAGLWLLPRLGGFTRLHPQVDLRLVASNAVLDLGGDIDLAIRYCTDRQAPAGAVKLFGETVAPVASPALAATLRGTGGLAALQAATLLEFDVAGRPWLQWAPWLAARGHATHGARGVLRYNQYEQVIQAAEAGQGVALGRLELLGDALAAGRLQRLDGPPTWCVASPCAYWLVQSAPTPGEDVQQVVRWLLETARPVNPAY